MTTPENRAVGSRTDQWSSLLSHLAQTRDEHTFSRIFEYFSPLIKSFYMGTMSYLQEDIIEELVQEVMCKVWLKAPSFNPSKSAANTWIYTIARNTRIDFLRKNDKYSSKTVSLLAEDIWDESLDNQPYVYLDKARDKSDLRELLSSLPNEQSQCLKKMYMEGKSHGELARELDLPLGTVKSRIRLGLKRLRTLLSGKEK